LPDQDAVILTEIALLAKGIGTRRLNVTAKAMNYSASASAENGRSS